MNNDAIDRQAAIDAIYETFCYAYCDNCEKEMNEDLCDDCHRKYQNWAASKKIISKTINSLPSAERHGHWVKDKNLYKCTACNDLLTVAGWADCIPEKQIYTAFKYCPNCGASMDEANE